MHRTPFRPLWTELKGFGSRRTVAGSPDGVHDCSMALRRFSPKDVLRETFLTQLAVAPDGSSVVYGRRTIEDGAYKTRLWRVPMSGGRAEQITTGDSDVAASVLARREDARLHLAAARGSRSRGSCRSPEVSRVPLAEFPGQAGAADWAPDGAAASPCSPRAARSGSASEIRSSPRARQIKDLNWRLDGAGMRDQFTSLWVVPARGGQAEAAHRAALRGRYRPSGPRTVERIGFLADPRPEAGLLEQPQAWSMPGDGGRPTKHAELARRDRGRGVLAAREACLRRAGRPIVRGSTNLGLWVEDGRSARRLGEELDRTFFFIVIGDLLDFGALCACAGALARRRERRRAGHRPRALRSVPLRARRLGRATGRARRRRVHVARVRRRPPRDDRERRRRRVRRLRDRGRRPAAAVTQRRQLVRPVSPGSGAACGAPPRRA